MSEQLEKTVTVKCPHCEFDLEVPTGFIKHNDRVCCMSCNKAFDIPPYAKMVSSIRFTSEPDSF